MIKTWIHRCQEHPDHQTGMVSHSMIQARMQEEINELRAALAQPDTEMPKTLCGPNLEQVLNAAGFYKRKPETEPVAWNVVEGTGVSYLSSEPPHPSVVAACRPLYTAPPQRKPLTKDEMWKLMDDEALWQFARAIERAHGIGGEE